MDGRVQIHPKLIATEAQCDALFQRLSGAHPGLKVFKLDVAARIDYYGSDENMVSYQRTAADSIGEDRIDPDVAVQISTGDLPESYYHDHVDACSRTLSDDLVEYRGDQHLFEHRVIVSETPTPVDEPGESKFHDLPPEVITNIVEHLALMSPVKPFPAVESKRPCPCKTPGSNMETWRRSGVPARTASKLLKETTDPTLALSCVSSKLRQIAFEERQERSYSLGFCHEAMKNTRLLPADMRKRVT